MAMVHVSLNKLRLSPVYIHVIMSIEKLIHGILPPDFSGKLVLVPVRVEAVGNARLYRQEQG
jgi:hypothetical protein